MSGWVFDWTVIITDCNILISGAGSYRPRDSLLFSSAVLGDRDDELFTLGRPLLYKLCLIIEN